MWLGLLAHVSPERRLALVAVVAAFQTLGAIDIITRTGRVVWSYAPVTVRESLDRPSLAARWPGGLIAVTGDWHHRVIAIDPHGPRIALPGP